MAKAKIIDIYITPSYPILCYAMLSYAICEINNM
jgi:hypothetical protein